MDAIGFVFGVSGMSMGLLGFIFGINASNAATSISARINQPEKRLGDAGLLDEQGDAG